VALNTIVLAEILDGGEASYNELCQSSVTNTSY